MHYMQVLISSPSTRDQIMCVRIFAVHVLICVWVSEEDEVVQNTGTHANQDDGVGMLMHRRQEATKPDKKFQRHSPRHAWHETACSYKCVLVGSVTAGTMSFIYLFYHNALESTGRKQRKDHYSVI